MDMEFYLDATRPPLLQVVPNSANITIVGAVDVNVIQANKTVATAFVLNVVRQTMLIFYIVCTLNCIVLIMHQNTQWEKEIFNFSVR